MAIKIFFNTKGTIEGEELITREQTAFLKYIETGEVSDNLTDLVDKKVKEVRSNKI